MNGVERPGVAKLFVNLFQINADWRQLEECGRLQCLPRGTTISNCSDTFFLLESGVVRKVVTSPQGQDWGVLLQQKGCLFNLTGALLGTSENVYFTCQTDVEVYGFDAALLQDTDFYRQHPEKIINLLTTFAVKEAIAHAYSSNICHASAKGRVCQSLLALLRENDHQSTFSPGTTQVEIAAMLGLHQTTVARAVKELRAEGVVGAFTKNRLEILNKERLIELASENVLTSEGTGERP